MTATRGFTQSLHTHLWHDAVLCRYASEVPKYHRKSENILNSQNCLKNHKVNKVFVHSLRKHYFENHISVLLHNFIP